MLSVQSQPLDRSASYLKALHLHGVGDGQRRGPGLFREDGMGRVFRDFGLFMFSRNHS